MPPTPSPFHILRPHHASVSALHFTHSNNYLFAGDQDGFVSVTDLSARRVVAFWQAHEGGVLGVDEWEGGLVSQGRDNIVHFYEPTPHNRAASLVAAGATSQVPRIIHSLPSNSVNFCRFSLARLNGTMEALLVLPNLTDSELVDIYHVPSFRRLHSAINFIPHPSRDCARSGLVMSVHLHLITTDATQNAALVLGYEDGRVEGWVSPLRGILESNGFWDGRRGEPVWKRLWDVKAHNEAVMAMAVDRDFHWAFTVSADHRLCKIDITKMSGNASIGAFSACSTNQIGNSSVAVSANGLVVAVGGWDGRIRLFSVATFKPLGVLAYHRESVQALAFANARKSILPSIGAGPETINVGAASDGDDSDDSDGSSKSLHGSGSRKRWLVSGGKDTRIALWGLMDFEALRR